MDMAIHSAEYLAKALQAPSPESTFQVGGAQLKAIRGLAKISDAGTKIPNRDALPTPLDLLMNKRTKLPRVKYQTSPPQRVDPENDVSFWDSNLSRYGHGEETYLSRYFSSAQNPPKWVLATGKKPSTVDVKETFHVDPRSPGDMAEKASQNSSHACQIVASKRDNN